MAVPNSTSSANAFFSHAEVLDAAGLEATPGS
jgi:hypothetical protein